VEDDQRVARQFVERAHGLLVGEEASEEAVVRLEARSVIKRRRR